MAIAALLTAVTVFAQTPREVNGTGEIQALFNGNFNGGGGGVAEAMCEPLKLNGARSFFCWMPGRPTWNETEKKLKAEGKPAGPDDVANEWVKQNFLETQREVVYKSKAGHYRQLDHYPKMGMDDNIAFHIDLPPTMVKHPEKSWEFIKGTTDAIREYAPYLKENMYYFFHNEPNYPNWTWYYKGDHYRACTDWIRQWDNLEDWAAKEGLKGFTQVGPCVASGCFFTWQGWENWVKRPLEEARHPLKIFQYHCYYIGAYSHFGWYSMLQSHAEKIGRPRPRSFMTEVNHCLWWDGWGGERCKWFAENFFMQLEHPDKFMFFSAHMGVHRWCSDIVIPDGKDEKGRTKWKLGEIGKLYKAFANLRGTGVEAVAEDPEVKTFASRPDGKTLAVAALNTGEAAKEVGLDVRELGMRGVTNVNVRTLKVVSRGEVKYEERNVAAGEAGKLRLEPWETAVLTYAAKEEVGKGRALQTRDAYVTELTTASLHNGMGEVKFRATEEMLALTAPKKTELRMAVACGDELYAHGFTLKFNGKKYPLRYSQTPKEVGRKLSSLFTVELPEGELKKENTIGFGDVDVAGTILFASVAVKEERGATLRRKAAEYPATTFTVKGPGAILDGESSELVLSADNAGAECEATVTLETPEQFEAEKTHRIKLAADSRTCVRIPVKGKANGDFGRKTIAVTVETAGGGVQKFTTEGSVETKYIVPYEEKEPSAEGKGRYRAAGGSEVRIAYTKEGFAVTAKLSAAAAKAFREKGLRAPIDLQNGRHETFDTGRAPTYNDWHLALSNGTVKVERKIWAKDGWGKRRDRMEPAGAYAKASWEERGEGGVLKFVQPWVFQPGWARTCHPFEGSRVAFDLQTEEGEGKRRSLIDGRERGHYPGAWPTFVLGKSFGHSK